MRRKLIVGNWKMNGSKATIPELLNALLQGSKELSHIELVILPPFVYLDLTEKLLSNTNIGWGAQNVSHEMNGAFTGEISVTMLKDFNCSYSIVGHSERRQLYKEDNQVVAAKFIALLRQGIKPIVCVGETLPEREQHKTLSVIENQLAAILRLNNNLSSLLQSVIAYEPVWAIGTGKTPEPEQVQEVHSAIRKQLRDCNKELALQIRIIYGGSVNPENVATFCSLPDVDGALVGGASLDARKFLEIGRLCNSLC